MSEPAAADHALYPVVQLIEEEFAAFGAERPPRQSFETLDAFSAWFLDSVVRLEKLVAQHAQRPPLSHEAMEILCRATMTATTLGEAIRLVENFSAMLHPLAGALELERAGDAVRFNHDSLRDEHTRGTNLLDVIGLFSFKQLFQWLTGGAAVPLRVCIGPTQRDDVLPFLCLFNTPVLTGGACNYLEYDAAALALPVTADLASFEAFFEYFPCGFFQSTFEATHQLVSAAITAALQRGQPVPGLEETAASLGFAPSTFRRVLAGEGHSFRALREDCLRQAAEEALAGSEVSIAELADRLGYSSADSFRNAFYRWTQESPSAFKARHSA